MRLPAYLIASRHGIFYFRWPIPVTLHPDGRRTDIKLSLSTRCRNQAKSLSRVLSAEGQGLVEWLKRVSMRYHDIRELVRSHFEQQFDAFRDKLGHPGGHVLGRSVERNCLTGSQRCD